MTPKFTEIHLLGGSTVTADINNVSHCRRCKKPIVWAVTKNLKNTPIVKTTEGKWMSHFADCKYAQGFRRDPGHSGDLQDEVERQKERERWSGHVD